MNLFFWLLLNLCVPIAGPFFMLALLAVTHGRSVARQLTVASIKDGQLFWSAIGLSASAIYERLTTLEHRHGLVSLQELAIVVFALVAFSCSILVMVATVKAQGDAVVVAGCAASVSESGAQAQPFGSVRASFWLTGGVALLSTLCHVYLS